MTPKQFKKLESKEDEWRRKLQKKEEELAARLKKADETWKKQFDDLEREMRNELEKKETEKKSLESERYSLQAKILKLEESSKLAAGISYVFICIPSDRCHNSCICIGTFWDKLFKIF